MHTSTRTLFWRRQDQVAGKSTHSLTKKSVPELNDQPTYTNEYPDVVTNSTSTLCASDTNTIVTSTKSIDLHKTVNITLELISELFQINQLVLNKNTTFAINFSCVKTPTDTPK